MIEMTKHSLLKQADLIIDKASNLNASSGSKDYRKAMLQRANYITTLVNQLDYDSNNPHELNIRANILYNAIHGTNEYLVNPDLWFLGTPTEDPFNPMNQQITLTDQDEETISPSSSSSYTQRTSSLESFMSRTYQSFSDFVGNHIPGRANHYLDDDVDHTNLLSVGTFGSDNWHK